MLSIDRGAYRQVIAASGRFENLVYDLARGIATERGDSVIRPADTAAALRSLSSDSNRLEQLLDSQPDFDDANKLAG